MSEPVRVLYVDDNPLDRELVRDSLQRDPGNIQVTEATSRAEFEAQLERSFDVVLSDFNILGYEGLQVIEAVRATRPDVPVIIVAGTGSEEVAVEAMKRGAADYVTKTPSHIQRLPATIHAALQSCRSGRERRQAAAAWEKTLDTVPDFIAILDREHRIVRVNRPMARQMGLMPEQCVGLPCYRYVHGTEQPPSYCPHTALLADGCEHTAELYEEGLGGHFSVSVSPLHDADGQLVGSVHVARDITQRKRAEGAVRISEKRYRTLVEAAQEGIGITDPNEKIVFANPAFARLLGRDPEELVGLNLSQITVPEEFAKYREETKKRQEGESSHYETVLRTKSGDLRDFAVSATPLFDDAGAFSGTLGLLTDVTGRRRAEKKLRESEAKLRSLYSSMIEGVCLHQLIYDESGKPIDYQILDVNPAYESILGISRTQAVGAKASELYGSGQPPYLEQYARVAESGEPFSFETYFPPMQKHFAISVFSPARGKFATVFSDVTERKRASDALRESHQRFRTLADMLPQTVCECDVNGKLTYVNRRAFEVFGYTREDFEKGLHAIEMLAPEDRSRGAHMMAAVMAGNVEPNGREYLAQRKDGAEFPVVIYSSPILHNEQPAGLRGIIVDVTEQKRRIEEIRHREAFERIVTQVSSGLVDVDNLDNSVNHAIEAIGRFCTADRAYVYLVRADGKTIDNTHEWCAQGVEPQIDNLQGISAEEELPWFWKCMQARKTFHVAAVRDLPPEARLEKEHFEMQDIQALIVVPMVCDDALTGFIGFDCVRGEKMWSEDEVVLLRIAADTVARAVVRKRVEEALRDQKAFIDVALNSMQDIFYVFDLSGKFLRWNVRVCEVTGYGDDEIAVMHVLDFFSSEDGRRVQDAIERAVREGNAHVEAELVAKDGTPIPYEFTGSLLTDSRGEAIGLCGCGRDITERKRAEEALHAASEEWQRSFDALTDHVCILDRSGAIVRANRTMRERFEPDHGDLIGLDYRLVYCGTTTPDPQPPCAAVLSGGSEVTVETQLPTMEGWYLVSSYPLADTQGEQVGAVSVVRDVTERKQVEDALRESEDKMRSIFSTVPGFILNVDREGKITFVNRTVPGSLAEEVVGTSVYEHIPADYHPALQRALEEVFARGEVVELETAVTPVDTEVTMWSLNRIGPVTKNGEIIGLTIASTDITERKRAEESLQRALSRLQELESIVNASPAVAMRWRVAEGWPVEFVSDNIRQYGYTAEDLASGQVSWPAITHPEDVPRLEKEVAEFLRRGELEFSQEYRLITKSGEVRWIEDRNRAIVDSSGKATHIRGVLYDVTEQKKAAEALAQSERELRKREAELAHMSRAHTVGEMAGTLAHELNQPLHAINNYVRGVQRRLRNQEVPPDPEALVDAMDHVSKEVNRAAGIVSHLREFVRGREPRRSSVDVRRLLQQAVELLQPVARDRGVALELDVSGELPIIQADPIQVEQVVVNLVTNAVDAAAGLPEKRRSVTIVGRLSETGLVEVTVRDLGRGIPEELKGKLFEAFVTAKENGLGVGLAISRSIVDSHGGKIWVVHNELHGSAFHFTLPVSAVNKE